MEIGRMLRLAFTSLKTRGWRIATCRLSSTVVIAPRCGIVFGARARRYAPVTLTRGKRRTQFFGGIYKSRLPIKGSAFLLLPACPSTTVYVPDIGCQP